MIPDPAEIAQASSIDIPELFLTAAADAGNAPALSAFCTSDPDGAIRRWTRKELARDIAAAAAVFEELGLDDRRRAAILLPTVPDIHLLLWGGLSVSGIGLINPLLRAEYTCHLLDAMAVDCLFVASPELDPGLADLGARIAADRPSLRRVEVGPGAEFGERLAAARGTGPYPRPRPAQAIAAMFHTGGTTGQPKVAPLTLANMLSAASLLQPVLDFKPADTFFCPLPLFHIAGAVVCGLAPLLAGSHVVMTPPAGLRDPAIVGNFWRMIERVGATMLVAVPTSLAALADVPLDGADLSALNYVLTGTSPLPTETSRRFTALTGKPIHTGYGMTETAGVITYAPRHGPARPTTVGPPLPGVEIRVEPLPGGSPDAGTPGRVSVRGPNVFGGYLHGPSRPADQWLDSGDLGMIDDEGWLTLTGRSKDLIIRGGHNIDPALIEEPAAAHEAVLLAAAVGQIDDYAGEVPALYVQLRPGYESVAAIASLGAALEARIAEPPARPRAIYAIDCLPVTAVGKVFKPDLRVDAARRRIEALLVEEGFGDAKLGVELGAGGELLVQVRLAGGTSDRANYLRRRLERFPVVAAVDQGAGQKIRLQRRTN